MENDQNILESKLEDEIVYFPEPWENYNGVLIVLREPGGGVTGKSEEWDFVKNRDWYRKVVGIDNENLDSWKREEKSQKTKYRNRFCEMLDYLGLPESELRNIAITNLKKSAGGPTKSIEYDEMEKPEPLKRKIDAIKQAGGTTHTVFLCREVFEDVVGQQHKTEFAICYKGKQPERAACIDGVWYFEIRHPSRSPEIIREQSILPAEYKLMAERKG